MDANAPVVFLRIFRDLPDPRRPNIRHLLTDILTIALLAVMCRSDDWEEVAIWAEANAGWLKTFLELPNGVPSEDTYSRLFARIDPDAFEKCFMSWTASLAEASEGRLIAIDGKSLRGGFRHAWNKQMPHLVSAWCETNELVLGQLATPDKGNEITAIPRLLALLDIKKAVVTIDAIGCQREIASQIVMQKGDYLLAVKGNQPTLEKEVISVMTEVELDRGKAAVVSSEADKTPNAPPPNAPLSNAPLSNAPPVHGNYFEKSESGHDRTETRRVWTTRDVSGLSAETRAAWPTIRSLAMVESTRQVLGDVTGKVTTERRYYISSLKTCPAQHMAKLIRGHWGVENKLHYRLDVCFDEDKSRVRKDHGPENLSRLRRVTINLLKNDKTPRRSLKNKRYKCSIDRDHLMRMLKQ